MDIGQLVTYMKLPDEVLSEPNTLPKEIMISTIELHTNTKLQCWETIVFDQDPIDTLQGPIKPSIDRCFGSEDPRIFHRHLVDSYSERGYRVFTHLDYMAWEKLLERIPGLDLFRFSDQEKERLEFTYWKLYGEGKI